MLSPFAKGCGSEVITDLRNCLCLQEHQMRRRISRSVVTVASQEAIPKIFKGKAKKRDHVAASERELAPRMCYQRHNPRPAPPRRNYRQESSMPWQTSQ